MTEHDDHSNDDGRGSEANAAEVPAVAASLVRSEQRLTASTERVVTGTAHLEKYLVPEDRTITVRVYREEVRLVHHDTPPGHAHTDHPTEPSHTTGAAANTTTPHTLDADRKPGNDTVVLWAEQPVITTTWVPVETARLQVTVVTTEHTVTDTVDIEHNTPLIGADLPTTNDQPDAVPPR